MRRRAFSADRRNHVSVHQSVETQGELVILVDADKRRHVVLELSDVGVAQGRERVLVAELLYGVHFDLDRSLDGLLLQAFGQAYHFVHHAGAALLMLVVGERAVLQGMHQLHFAFEYLLRKRFRVRSFGHVLPLAEEFEIAAVVEYEEALFADVLAIEAVFGHDVGAEARAPSDHLPELRLRANLLEEHQVEYLGNVDAGVHHVDGDGDHGKLFELELVDDGVCVVIAMHNAPDEPALGQLRIQLAEALHDVFRMAFVLGEDDCLAKALAAMNLDAVLHEVLQHRVDGFLVEDPRVQLRRGGEFRGVGSVGFFPVVVIAFAVALRQVVVGYALFQKFGADLYIEIGNEVLVLIDSGVIFVHVRRNAALHLEEIVGVPIDLIFGSGGEAHHLRVEVVEYGAVFLEDGAMRLIDDDQVEMRWRVQALAVVVLQVVDGVEDGRIGGEHDARVFVFLLILRFAEVAQAHVG